MPVPRHRTLVFLGLTECQRKLVNQAMPTIPGPRPLQLRSQQPFLSMQLVKAHNVKQAQADQVVCSVAGEADRERDAAVQLRSPGRDPPVTRLHPPARLQAPVLAAIDRLDEITGIGREGAQVIIAEIGLDMIRFGTPGHLVSWAKLSARTIQYGSHSRAGRTGKGNAYLKGLLGEAAAAAARSNTFLGERYRRIVKRRGKLKVAVARSILTIVWHLLHDPPPVTTTSATTTTPTGSTNNARSTTTSANYKPSATGSASKQQPEADTLTIPDPLRPAGKQPAAQLTTHFRVSAAQR